MKVMQQLFRAAVLPALVLMVLIGCGPGPAGEVGTEIVSAGDAWELVEGGAVLVDARSGGDYQGGHIEGAVNISRADIVINDPFPNLLAPADQIESVMGRHGIGNDTTVVVYDANKGMDSARLWWTLKIYGHDDVKVVDGGFAALQAEGLEPVTSAPSVSAATFTAAARDDTMIIDTRALRDLVNNPEPNVCVIDTRSEAEYMEGTIPGSILLDFNGNLFSDGTFRPARHIRIRYLEAGADYDDTVVLYCKTSIRGAQTYLAMYNAGYRDLKLYDEAWVGWTANPLNPVFVPEPAEIQLRASDNS